MFTFGKVLRAGVLAAGMLTAGTAAAQTVTLGAALSGAQERPTPVTTTGFGFGQLTYDQAQDRVTVSLTVRDLTSNTMAVGPGGSAGHVHVITMANGNGPIALPLVNASTLAADPSLIGVRGFDYAQTFTFAQLRTIGGIDLTALDLLRTRLIAAIGASQGTPVQAYFNVHTVAFPGGEIRGDLAVVPEPSTYALLGTGLAGIGMAARRRRVAKA
jgi:hypothetical protein